MVQLHLKKTLVEGLPQSSVLRCTLFPIFTHDLPPLLNTSKALLSDDLFIWTTENYQILSTLYVHYFSRYLGTYRHTERQKVSFYNIEAGESNLQLFAFTSGPVAAPAANIQF